MNFTEITTFISETEGVPAGKVRKVSKALLARMAEAIDNGEKLQLPELVFSPRILPSRDADGEKPARPERKVVMLRRRQGNSDKVVSSEKMD